MTSIEGASHHMTSAPATPARRPHRRPQLALLAGAVVFAATGLFDLATHPSTQHGLRTYKEYVFTALLIPFALAALWALTDLHTLQCGRGGRLARVGLRIAAVGLLAFIVDAIVTLASASTDTAGPLYPLAMLISLIGIGLLAAASIRASVLPRWAGPAIAIAWVIGGPVGEGGILRGTALILAAVFGSVAVALPDASTRAGADPGDARALRQDAAAA